MDPQNNMVPPAAPEPTAPVPPPATPPQPSEPPVPVPLRPKPEPVEEPAPMGSYVYDQKPRRLGKILTFLVIAIAVLIVAAGAGAAYIYTASGDGVIRGALEGIDTAKKTHMTWRIEAEADKPIYDGSYGEVVSEIDRSSGPARAQATLTLNAGALMFSVEGKYIDKTLYGRIVSIPEQYKMFIGDVVNRWYSISVDTIEQAGKDRGYDLASSSIRYKTPAEWYSVFFEKKILGEPAFMGVKNTERGWVREYSILINKDALAEYAIDSSQSVQMSPEMADQAKKSIRQELEKVSFDPIIARTSLLSGDLQSVTFKVNSVGQTGGFTSVTISLDNDETKTNFTVTVPENVTALDDMYKQYAGSSQIKAQNARVQSLIHSARVAAELYYDKARSYTSFCTKDAETKKIFDQIKETSSTVTCRSTAQTYLMAVKLAPVPPASTTSYQCVDSTGKSIIIPKVPTGYVCK